MSGKHRADNPRPEDVYRPAAPRKPAPPRPDLADQDEGTFSGNLRTPSN